MEQQKSALDIVRELCERLETRGIAYCHWKSNAALDRSASGDNDLDFLVSRREVQGFTEILCRLNFKEARVPVEKQLPGILNYYGYDEKADKFVHVHAHYQLVLGHDATKNHRLAIERPFLESVIQDGLFKIPSPEFEWIVFVIRMILKHSTWDAILSKQGTLSKTEQQELSYLQPRVNHAKTLDILKQHMPYIDATLFDECVRSLISDYPIWTRIKVELKLQNRLEACSRRSQIQDTFLKLWRQFSNAVQRRVFFENRHKKKLAGGGVMIAIVGGDGAGKSTVIDELYIWLSKNFATKKVHMGKPKWSCTSKVIRGFLKIGRSLGLYPYSRLPKQNSNGSNSLKFPGYPSLVREVCVARDRFLTYIKAHRFTTDGGLAICDRFPLPQIRMMDGFQTEWVMSNDQKNWIINYLISLEKKYYQSIMLPELLIVLRINPEIAVQRKFNEDASSVRARSTEIWELDWGQTPAHIIDASRSKAEVLSELKALIWSEL